MPATPDPSSGIRHLNDALKVAIPVLAFMAAALGIAGDKWDKEKRRPTKVGYAVFITAVLVAVVSILSWRVDDEVKHLDSAASDLRQAAAVEEQKKRDQQTLTEFGAVNTALIQANSAQQKALALALRQLPIDEIDLYLERSEIENVLPKELRAAIFSFQKPPGRLATASDDFHTSFYIPSERSMLDAMKSGQAAVKSFHSVVEHICKIEITSASIPEGESAFRFRIGGEFYLTTMVVDRHFLTYRFAPDGLSASYFDGNRARLEIVRQIGVSVGNTDPPPLRSCVTPHELRLRFRSFGFVGDTGLFKLNWIERYDSSTALSPIIKFTPSTSPDQPSPPR